MSQLPYSPLQRTVHECTGDAECGLGAPGHGLLPIQERVALATPSKWVDAVVASVDATGLIELNLLADDSTIVVWNHADLSASLHRGDPVSLHSVYDVLNTGDANFNVARLGIVFQ